MKMQEIKMTYLITWGFGPEEVKCSESRAEEETHPLVMASFSRPKLSSNTSIFRTSS